MKRLWYRILIWNYNQMMDGIWMDQARGYIKADGAKFDHEYYQGKINAMNQKLNK